ncbi:MAG TPA: hypothetical protein VGX96_03225 [Candidatus Elarobacter sp.]|jgi:hypothetical protein|nr:hypothetical protein [Candidatus Elarobacter sp.]
MRTLLRRVGVTFVALSFALCSIPAPAESLDDDTAHALSLLQQGCGAQATQAEQAALAHAAQVAQAASPSPAPAVSASPAPAATATASPSPFPSPYVGTPVAPLGPQILVPPVPSPSPGAVTPPPLPTATPVPSGSPAPVIITPQTAPPSSSPIPAPSATSGPIVNATPSPSPSPAPGDILEPNTYAILGDKLSGTNKPGQPFDLDGHVNIFYQDGVLGGDHAHYDGQRYIDITGNTFVKNRSGDTVLFADSVRFDEHTQKATLLRGRGESTQGVEQGKLHFAGASMVTDRNGVTHVEHANLTTCENPRGGYHLESKTLDVYPGDKAVARSAVLFLGALAIFYLPIAVISLRHDELGSRRQPGFIPIVGYSQQEGFYIKARIGFSPSDYYYGYYRVEEYTRIGLGLGYVGTLRRKDGRRQTDLSYFRMKNKVDGSNSNNMTFQDQEIFSRSLRAQVGLNYTGNYGPLVSLPPQYDLTAAIAHGNETGSSHQNYSFHRSSTGSQASTVDYGITDHRAFGTRASNDLTVSYTTSRNVGYPGASTLHYSTLTHYTGRSYDWDLTYDRYDTTTPSNVQREPELAIHPHDPLFPRFRAVPITVSYLLGEYDDPQAQVLTPRGEARLVFGPALAHFLASDLSATVNVQQDAYGTGDLKAQIQQQATLTTPLFGHVLNVISYTEAHVNGPLAEPFKTIDVLGNGSKQATDNLRIFNGDTYALSLTATTFFNRQAQSVGYQLTSRPSRRSTLLLGGSFTPGRGNGFDRTNVQLSTPFGYQSDLQLETFVDWKKRGKLESKNIYYRHIVGDCYEIRLAYNEDLKQVTASINLLAFPSRGINFGLGQTSLSSIIPQSFSSTAFGNGGAF